MAQLGWVHPPLSMTSNRRSRFAQVAVLPALLFGSLGFDLDRGELKCEQAAVHLSECCPDVVLVRSSCIQEGGCGRSEESTIVTMEESDCIRSSSCDELAEQGLCERLQARIDLLEDPDGPSIQTLYQEDSLCD